MSSRMRHTDIHTDIERLSLARSQDNPGTTGHHKIRMRSPIVERNYAIFYFQLVFFVYLEAFLAHAIMTD